jgi:hypothetical protein
LFPFTVTSGIRSIRFLTGGDDNKMIREKLSDTDLLDWLEKQEGCAWQILRKGLKISELEE